MTNHCPLCSSATFANGDCVAMHKHGLLTAHVVVLPNDVEEYYIIMSARTDKSVGELMAKDLNSLYRSREIRKDRKLRRSYDKLIERSGI